jgi:hypothetical protein
VSFAYKTSTTQNIWPGPKTSSGPTTADAYRQLCRRKSSENTLAQVSVVYREVMDETDRQRGYREDARVLGEIGEV